ncbi:MAG: hypothetical protein M1541_02180 [Acidobacteria bacterium]|nr:hypothetical protein [Acidobacteriota bacterium]
MTLKSPTKFGAVYATAMDGLAPLREARRMLITAVGPARNRMREVPLQSESGRLKLSLEKAFYYELAAQ